MPAKAGGRARFAALLASSSIAALLLSDGAPPAYAACSTTYINTSSPGCTNSAAITGIAINNSNINGAITNSGTISPNGIVLTNGSTVIGGINDTGTIRGGISLDSTSAIGASGAGIAISGPTFSGGISNAGEIVTASDGINVSGVFFSNGIIDSGAIFASATGISIAGSTFAGGVTNSGTITATINGIDVTGVSTFLGGVTNSGTITATINGIGVAGVSTFLGGITNIGTISVHSGDAIRVQGVSTFAGGIVNSGTISAPLGVFVLGVSTFGDGISNGGKISVVGTGIGVSTGSVFSGGITNSGTISSAGAIGVGAVSISTFSGGITNSGTVSSGGASAVAAMSISTFAGGMTNSGTIFASVEGMSAQSMSTFSGGMINRGSISAGGSGIVVVSISTFLGGVTNSGQIAAGARNGIAVTQVETFANGISNSGTISASGTSGIGIQVSQVTSFANGISNSGTISSAGYGLFVGATNTSSVSNFSGGFANSGTITAARNAIDLSFVSTFAGGMTNSGTISSSAGNGMLAFRVSMFSGGIVNRDTISAALAGIDATNVSAFSGDIINSGSISAGTNGIAVVSVSTFLGSITNTGTISAAHGIVISNTTGVSVFDSGTIIGTSGFAINFSTGPNTLTLGPGFDIQGKVIGSGADIFQLGGIGGGNFNLGTVGPGLQYEGFTAFNVIGGVWDATGTFGQAQAWNVNGGTLAGTGTFQSINVNAGGALAPGTPGAPGAVMTINGSLTFAPGAIYLVNLSPTTASRANVTGGVTLNGMVQGYFAPGSYNKATTYDILDPSSISGTFTGFTAVNSPGFGGTLTYQTNDVLLNLTAQLGSGGGLNVNQQNVANAVNAYFNNGGTLPAGFLPLFGLSGAALGNALSQLSGEPATDAGKGANQLMNDFLNVMLDPTAAGGGGTSGGGATGFAPEQDTTLPPDVALAYAKALRKAAPLTQSPANFDQRWTAWGSAFGGTSFTNGNAAIGSNNVNASDYGFAAGMDYHATPDTIYGFGLAGGGTNWNLAQGLGSGKSDSFQAGLYAKTHAGPVYLSAAVAFANHWFTTDRIAFADQLRASFTGQSYAARLEAGYRYAVPITGALVGVTPYAALQAQDFHTPSYSETDLTGGGFGLSYNSMNATDTRSELGARFDNLQIVDSMPLILRARLAWAHDWYTNATALNAAFATLPGSSFTVNGAALLKNSALTTAAAELHITSTWTVTAKFDGDFGSGSQTYGGTGTLCYSW